MVKVALLCNGTTLPDKIFDEDIIVRVNHGIPRKDKRTDIWFFGDGENYEIERFKINANRVIGYSNCMERKEWWEVYPLDDFKYLCSELGGKQPSIGLMALFWLIQENMTIHIYGMDFFDTGHYYDHADVCQKVCRVHDFYKEEELVKSYIRKGWCSMGKPKSALNRAILEPRETKRVATKCECGTVNDAYRSRCVNCNRELRG
jgi:hypothetical protein